jgi:hypothetical protein
MGTFTKVKMLMYKVIPQNSELSWAAPPPLADKDLLFSLSLVVVEFCELSLLLNLSLSELASQYF